ncbi:hypothetical protein PYCC9005_004851 [Savitreella phatthalungensis]
MLAEEVARHNKRDDLWVILYGQAWDLSTFVENHPGGVASILRYAGLDATEAFDPVHPPGILATLDPGLRKGDVEGSTLTVKPRDTNSDVLPLDAILNLDDFEANAQKSVSPRAWAYFSSAADTEWTHINNRVAYEKLLFRPRVLRDVRKIDLSVQLLGYKSTLPVYTAPAATARLSHPDGEVAIAKACGSHGVFQCLSQHASCTLEQVAQARTPAFYQLYCLRSDDDTKSKIRQALRAGFASIWVTVDTASNGTRTRDERNKNIEAMRTGNVNTVSQATANATNHTCRTAWEDLTWIMREARGLPVVLKGIQSVEDALLARKAGCRGICISNHGGRNLEFSQPSIYVLYEVFKYAPDLIRAEDFDIFVDGGIRHGTDVIKALCLGATAVGIGRSPLYALASYGQAGVEKMFEILKQECESVMRLIGCDSVRKLGPHYLNMRALDREIDHQGIKNGIKSML